MNNQQKMNQQVVDMFKNVISQISELTFDYLLFIYYLLRFQFELLYKHISYIHYNIVKNITIK